MPLTNQVNVLMVENETVRNSSYIKVCENAINKIFVVGSVSSLFLCPLTYYHFCLQTEKRRDQEEPPKLTVILPYVAGVSEDSRRICRKFDIRTVFTTITTLRKQLTRVKDTEPIAKRSGVVYQGPCSCGLVYIGETKRILETCLREHMAPTRWDEFEKSAIAEHVWTHQQYPQWDKTSILDADSKKHVLVVKEALHIMSAGRQTLLNRDQGTTISDCWKPMLQLMPGNTAPGH